jgi:phosphatidylglycerol lysyltransferase
MGCSLLALILMGLYEARALREAGRPLGVLRPMLVTAIAAPIGHSVGLATLTGGAMRYRLYAPLGIPASTIGTVIVYTALPYVLGLSLLLGFALIFGASQAARLLSLPVASVVALGVIGLAVNAGYVLLTALRRTPISLGRFTFRLPSLPFTLLQYAIGSLSIICLATILDLFLPPELPLSFPAHLGVYVLSLIGGNLSNVPAGLGIFDAALLLLLRDVPSGTVLAAIVAYRVVYELLQLVLALGLLALYEFGSRHGLAGRLWRKPQFEGETHGETT